jgi:hypothetical protein
LEQEAVMQFIALLLAAYFAVQYIFGDTAGCEEYASKYSCRYLTKNATYDVYYWRNLERQNGSDDRYIGTTTGLAPCRDMAMLHAAAIEPFRNWNERAYICVLKRDGEAVEKHRWRGKT